MIFHAIPPHGAVASVAIVAEENAVTSRTFQAIASGAGHQETLTLAGEREQGSSELRPFVREVHEEIDWGNPKTQRDFIRLEQKVLAKKASPEDEHRYQAMRRDRNSEIFADRALRDYAEVQRLKKLSEKLQEIQRYLRPFKI